MGILYLRIFSSVLLAKNLVHRRLTFPVIINTFPVLYNHFCVLHAPAPYRYYVIAVIVCPIIFYLPKFFELRTVYSSISFDVTVDCSLVLFPEESEVTSEDIVFPNNNNNATEMSNATILSMLRERDGGDVGDPPRSEEGAPTYE